MSLEDLGLKTGNAKAKILAKTLDAATGTLLDNNRIRPARPVNSTTEAAQFYLAMYWAQELAAQDEDAELRQLQGAGG